MSKESSLREADRVVAADRNAEMFELRCTCGWSAHERPGSVAVRISRHFSYPEALQSEHVTTTVLDVGEETMS